MRIRVFIVPSALLASSSRGGKHTVKMATTVTLYQLFSSIYCRIFLGRSFRAFTSLYSQFKSIQSYRTIYTAITFNTYRLNFSTPQSLERLPCRRRYIDSSFLRNTNPDPRQDDLIDLKARQLPSRHRLHRCRMNILQVIAVPVPYTDSTDGTMSTAVL